VFNENLEYTICPGESVALSANGNPDGTFVWTPSAGLSNSAVQAPNATPSVSTEYCYTYTDVCGNSTTSCVQVNIESPPVVSAGNADSFCTGDPYTLVGTCDQADALLQWTTVDGNFTGAQDALQAGIDAPGAYTLTATSLAAGCVGYADVVIAEIPLPQPIINSPIEKCSYDEVTLDIGNTWEEITWLDGSHNGTYTVSAEGNYDVTITENGCDNTVTFVVNDVALPNIELGTGRLICEGDTAFVDAGVVVVWNGTITTDILEATTTGDYAAEYELNGCFERDTVHVEVQMPPVINLGVDTVFCEGQPFALQSPLAGQWQDGSFGSTYEAAVTGAYDIKVNDGPCVVRDSIHLELIYLPTVDLGYDPTYCIDKVYEIGADADNVDYYTWSTGDTTETISVKETIDLELVVGNVCGTVFDSLHVTFEDCSAFVYLPTAFTPNGDDINDEYWASAMNVESFDLKIFDAWGNLVHQSNDPKKPWIGDTVGGESFVQNGIYNYLVSYRTGKGNVQERRGFIQLIR
jgi:gliding motility-associated-like protein